MWDVLFWSIMLMWIMVLLVRVHGWMFLNWLDSPAAQSFFSECLKVAIRDHNIKQIIELQHPSTPASFVNDVSPTPKHWLELED